MEGARQTAHMDFTVVVRPNNYPLRVHFGFKFEVGLSFSFRYV